MLVLDPLYLSSVGVIAAGFTVVILTSWAFLMAPFFSLSLESLYFLSINFVVYSLTGERHLNHVGQWFSIFQML